MNRVLVIVTALAILIGTVPCEATTSLTDTMQEVNDSTRQWYETCVDALLQAYDKGNTSDTLVVCLHYYLMLYDASQDIGLSLTGLPLSQIGRTNDRIVLNYEKTNRIVDNYKHDTYNEYIDGTITSDEYVEKVRKLYESGKEARKQAEEEIKNLK